MPSDVNAGSETEHQPTGARPADEMEDRLAPALRPISAEDGTTRATMPLRKLADHPHWWTIGLSCTAILLSVGSLYESRESRRVNLATAQATVQVTQAHLLAVKGDFVRVALTVSNLGKATARQVQMYFKFARLMAAGPTITDTLFREKGTQSISEYDIVQGGARTVFLPGPWLATSIGDYTGGANNLIIYGITAYVDSLTGTKRQDAWCFSYNPRSELQTSTQQLFTCSSNVYVVER